MTHRIPYSDLADMGEEGRARLADRDEPLEFGHTLDDLIGGQIAAGFALTGFFEDIDPGTVLADHIPSFIATRAWKPGV